ncbi:MAG: antitoxin [Candidatus Micrarchaeia archaeon]
MTSAIVNLTEENNRFLNIIKAHFGIRNKSDAINFVVENFPKEEIELEVRPEYIRKLQKIRKQKGKVYNSAQEMLKEFEKDV